jgi:hypothetical protein
MFELFWMKYTVAVGIFLSWKFSVDDENDGDVSEVIVHGNNDGKADDSRKICDNSLCD